MSGMITSHTTRSGSSRRIWASASIPEAADSTSIRRLFSARSTTVLTLKLSSTTRTFAMLSSFLAVGEGGRLGRTRAGPAFVDVGSDAQEELVHAPRDGLGQVGQLGPIGLVEPEGRVDLPLRCADERGEGRLAGLADEARVDEPARL